ncbi:MAG TPA: hypothetical protein VGX94_02175 [Terriglobia bacterium]|nr:hypothetical protein [Terriglobia bacterium]
MPAKPAGRFPAPDIGYTAGEWSIFKCGTLCDERSTLQLVRKKASWRTRTARMWGLGRETVRKLVKDESGVIKIRMGRKKAHTVYSVPESAARRIYTRLLSAA